LQASAHNLNDCVAFAGSTTREDIVDADGCVEEAAIITGKDVCEDTAVSARSLLRGRLNNHLWGLNHALSTVAKVSLAPRVGFANDIEGESSEFAARNLVELRKRLTLNIIADLLRVPACLCVTEAGLSVDTEAPLVKVTTLSKTSGMPETS